MIKAYYKLTRDKIPSLIKKSGKKATIKKIEKTEFKHNLKIKLKEEVDEIMKTESEKNITERIADIEEIIEYLIKEYNITKIDIQKEKRQKAKKKGRYDKKIFLVLTEE